MGHQGRQLATQWLMIISSFSILLCALRSGYRPAAHAAGRLGFFKIWLHSTTRCPRPPAPPPSPSPTSRPFAASSPSSTTTTGRTGPCPTGPSPRPIGRPKATPGSRDADTDNSVCTDPLDANGTVILRHAGKLYHIGTGRTHAPAARPGPANPRHQRWHRRHLLRELTLDPPRSTSPPAARQDAHPRHHAHPANTKPRTPDLGSGSFRCLATSHGAPAVPRQDSILRSRSGEGCCAGPSLRKCAPTGPAWARIGWPPSCGGPPRRPPTVFRGWRVRHQHAFQ